MYDINGLSFDPSTNAEFFTRSLFGGRLVQSGKIRIMTGVKGDERLSQIDLQNKILQLDGKDCAWTPNQIIKLSEKIASVKTYKVNLEECIDDLENKRTAYLLKAGAKNEELPDELEEATMFLISIGLSNEIEEMIIGGDSSKNPNDIDGMQTILLKSTETAKVKGAKLTKDNVLAQFEKGYDKVTEEVLQAEENGSLFAFCSYSARRKLRNALTSIDSQRIAQNWTLDDTDKRNPIIFYLGTEVVAVKGIDEDTIIFTTDYNSLLLTDLLGDMDEMELGQMPKPNDNKIFIKGRMRIGFVVPFEDEAVIVSPLVETEQDAKPIVPLRVVPTNLVFGIAGEKKTFTVITDAGEEISIDAKGSGFTVTKGETTAGVTTVEVEVDENHGNIYPRTGQAIISVVDKDRTATVMLEQTNSTTINVTK